MTLLPVTISDHLRPEEALAAASGEADFITVKAQKINEVGKGEGNALEGRPRTMWARV
nr:hypothetical protein [uncultured Cohaesibacter sp.]